MGDLSKKIEDLEAEINKKQQIINELNKESESLTPEEADNIVKDILKN